MSVAGHEDHAVDAGTGGTMMVQNLSVTTVRISTFMMV